MYNHHHIQYSVCIVYMIGCIISLSLYIYIYTHMFIVICICVYYVYYYDIQYPPIARDFVCTRAVLTEVSEKS